ncbi:MAG: DMT family transporter [bacterium]|nr:DMT family transporter [bacterium]
MTDSRENRALVVTGLVLVQVFFGLNYLAAKLILEEIPPRAWALLRAGGAAVIVLAVVLLARRRLPRSPVVWLKLAGLALLGVVVNQVCFIEGLSRTTPTHSALINTTIPIDTMLFAVLLGREKLRRGRVAALLVALAGVLLVILPGASTGTPLLTGDLLTVVNAASFSLFLVLSRRLVTQSDPLGASAVLLLFGTLGIATIGLPQLMATDLAAVSSRTWGFAAFVIVFPTAGAYLINYWALARVDSSVVAFFIFLQPVLATGLSMLLLGEQPAVSVYVGAALIFLGVFLELRPAPRD